MQQFTTTKDGFKEIRKKLLILFIITEVVIVLIGVYIVPNIFSDSGPDSSLIFTLIMTMAVAAFSHYTSVKRQRKMFESFRLTITNDSVIRETINMPTISIPKHSVREIFRTANGTICIVGESKLNGIVVPPQIENREELVRVLSEIKPITIKTSQSWSQYAQGAGIILVVGLCALGLLNDNRIISSISAVGICAFLITGVVLAHRSKNIDRRMKRLSYMTIIPVLAILSYAIIKWLPA
jgi:hypothetical protein